MKIPSERSSTYRNKWYWWSKTKSLLTSKIDQSSLPGIFLKKVWKRERYIWYQVCLRSLRVKDRLAGNCCSCIESDGLYWISPDVITYAGLREFHIDHYKGRVIGGEWDLLEKKFTDLDVYIAFDQVIQGGKRWQETVFFERISEQLSRGIVHWGCSNEQDFESRCKRNEYLFHTIKDHGYKTQEELLQDSDFDPQKKDDEITVNIGRRGDLLFSNCAHRLAIAKILHLDKVPVKVAVRHPDWVSFVKKLCTYIESGVDLPSHAFNHPDLVGLRSSGLCKERYKLVKNNSSIQDGRLLDMGAKFGYLCQRFGQDGFQCFATEATELQAALLREINYAEQQTFEVLEGLGVGSLSGAKQKFDIVFLFNNFHDYLATRSSYEKLVVFLERLEVRELFFEPENPDRNLRKDAYREFTQDECVDMILRHSSLADANVIGTTSRGNPVYKIYG